MRNKRSGNRGRTRNPISNLFFGQYDNKAIYVRVVRAQMRDKLACLFVLAVLALLLLLVAYFRLTSSDFSDYAVKVLNNYSYTSDELEAPRGLITDRNGTTLAYSETYYLLILEPKNILDEDCYELTVKAIEKALGVPAQRVKEVLSGEDSEGNPMKDKTYYRFREEDGKTLLKITEEQAAEFNSIKNSINVGNKKEKGKGIKALYDLSDEEWTTYVSENEGYNSYQIQGVVFEKQFERIYPYNDLACKVVGYYTGSASTGIENSYDEYLAGVSGKSFSYLDGNYNVSSQLVDETQGYTVVSTIDMNVQRIVERAIGGYMKEYGAENVAVMVVNPNNGEILAMADDKNYNLNEPVTYPSGVTAESYANMSESEQKKVLEEMYSVQRLYCTTSPYEPGSIFKPITIAAALEEGTSHPTDEFNCTGSLVVRNRVIHCHNHLEGGCGEINLMGALANSCNVALMQIVAGLGAEKFDEYFKRFGFGQKTGIDLPGEEKGIIFSDYTKETELELATSSFGQGFASTMIQMTAAFSSLVNGGYYYTPHVVKEILTTDGKLVESYDTTAKYSTISAPTSEYSKASLYNVVENGTGTFCKIEGYNIGGKTGTAEQSPRGTDLWIASFVSAAPIENPEILVYVVVDKTHDKEWHDSSKPAQIVSKAIWAELLPYYNLHSNLNEYDYLWDEEPIEFTIDSYDGSSFMDLNDEEKEEASKAVESSENEGKETTEAESGSDEAESTEATSTGEAVESSETEELTEPDTTEDAMMESSEGGEYVPEETPSEVIPAETLPTEETPEGYIEGSETAEPPSEEPTAEVIPSDTEALKPVPAEGAEPVSLEAVSNGPFPAGHVISDGDIVVYITYSDGTVIANPDGWGMDNNVVGAGLNQICVMWGNLYTYVDVIGN